MPNGVERLLLAVPQGCLRFVIVVFPDHTHLLFLTECIELYGYFNGYPFQGLSSLVNRIIGAFASLIYLIEMAHWNLVRIGYALRHGISINEVCSV